LADSDIKMTLKWNFLSSKFKRSKTFSVGAETFARSGIYSTRTCMSTKPSIAKIFCLGWPLFYNNMSSPPQPNDNGTNIFKIPMISFYWCCNIGSKWHLFDENKMSTKPLKAKIYCSGWPLFYYNNSSPPKPNDNGTKIFKISMRSFSWWCNIYLKKHLFDEN